jgi:Skp family chaperone for outer membrane proteins
VGRWSGAVYHAMGILQVGLYNLASKLDIEFKAEIELENWKNIIDRIQREIDDRLRKLEQEKKSIDKDNQLRMYSEIAQEFTYFKNAWRNHVAHLRQAYDEEQARLILTHVKQFMQRLAS